MLANNKGLVDCNLVHLKKKLLNFFSHRKVRTFPDEMRYGVLTEVESFEDHLFHIPPHLYPMHDSRSQGPNSSCIINKHHKLESGRIGVKAIH